jgi:hypothetical protein
MCMYAAYGRMGQGSIAEDSTSGKADRVQDTNKSGAFGTARERTRAWAIAEEKDDDEVSGGKCGWRRGKNI